MSLAKYKTRRMGGDQRKIKGCAFAGPRGRGFLGRLKGTRMREVRGVARARVRANATAKAKRRPNVDKRRTDLGFPRPTLYRVAHARAELQPNRQQVYEGGMRGRAGFAALVTGSPTDG